MRGIITNPRQVATYMRERARGSSQQHAADQAGICVRTGKQLEGTGHVAKVPRTYRTRPDVFADDWLAYVEPELHKKPPLQAKVLFDALQKRFPGKYADSLRRTFERRIRSWRAAFGPDQEIFFPQEHPPGWQGIVDFTVCDSLEVTIGGEPFPHRLGHFRLACSGWSFANVILGGESFPALAETVRMSFARIGGVPQTLRTDSLSAAYKNLSQQQDLTTRYLALCQHYRCDGTRNNRGEAHENGSIESPNGHLKTAIDQALTLRGTRDFSCLADYRAFVDGIIDDRNRQRHTAFLAEVPHLRPLPASEPVTWSEAVGVVSSQALIRVMGVSYMVPSRLNGHRLIVRIYDDRLEFFDSRACVHACAREHRPGRSRQVNYHLVIHALVRKPGAFARLIYRDDLHPRPVFARTWLELRDRLSEPVACRTYVRLLHLAHEHVCEEALAQRLGAMLDHGLLPDVEALRRELAKPRLGAVPAVNVPVPNPTAYDCLLGQPLASPPTPAISA
jgi:hypothetical protein